MIDFEVTAETYVIPSDAIFALREAVQKFWSGVGQFRIRSFKSA
jgi:hypothetical protein